tara:strand:+ start:4015 stop:4455 length:441 start_codon:yes stop_codon:yes gene_type:complete
MCNIGVTTVLSDVGGAGAGLPLLAGSSSFIGEYSCCICSNRFFFSLCVCLRRATHHLRKQLICLVGLLSLSEKITNVATMWIEVCIHTATVNKMEAARIVEERRRVWNKNYARWVAADPNFSMKYILCYSYIYNGLPQGWHLQKKK